MFKFQAFAQQHGGGSDAKETAAKYRESVRGVPLAYLRIRQFLHLEDQHIPLPIINLYYTELEKDVAEQNPETLMVCMMLLRDWHVTRNELNFVRDVSKVAVSLAKRFTDNLTVVEVALNAQPVTPQDVYESIMRKMFRRCTQQQITLSEYLRLQYNSMQRVETQSKSLDMLFPEASLHQQPGLWNSFAFRYTFRVFKHALKTVSNMDSNERSLAHPFFEDSAPTWSQRACESTRPATGVYSVAEDIQMRRRLMDRLMRPTANVSDIAASPDDGETVQPTNNAQADDDAQTIDTEAFVREWTQVEAAPHAKAPEDAARIQTIKEGDESQQRLIENERGIVGTLNAARIQTIKEGDESQQRLIENERRIVGTLNAARIQTIKEDDESHQRLIENNKEIAGVTRSPSSPLSFAEHVDSPTAFVFGEGDRDSYEGDGRKAGDDDLDHVFAMRV